MTDSAAPTASTHGLTPSPPSASTATPAERSQSQPPQPQSDGGPASTLAAPAADASQPDPNAVSFGADLGSDVNFLDGADGFDFGLGSFDTSNFDFGMYLAELEGGDSDEVGVV